jgi:hypothetical protein
MSDTVIRVDLHKETTPAGATVILPQFVKAVPQASQNLVEIQNSPVLVEGDKFACQHVPKVGPFTEPLPAGTGEGKLSNPGQNVLKINNQFVSTLDGTNTSCSEGVREMSNRATVVLGGPVVVKVNGAPVMTGR